MSCAIEAGIQNMINDLRNITAVDHKKIEPSALYMSLAFAWL